MLNKALTIINNKLEETLSTQGFKRVKADSQNENEKVSLFTSETVAYSVIYYVDKKHMILRSCTMTDEGPDNEWKTLATWMFDPESDTENEANSIGNDFVDCVSSPVAVKRQKQTKKKSKSSDEGNADPIFFSKRLVTFFPELKDEIKLEEESYFPFRGVTFAQEHIVPKVKDLVKNGKKAEIEKLMQTFSHLYANGDKDTRSIITIVVLNSIDPSFDEKIKEFMSEDLQKAFKAGVKYRNKEVKPEKEKKKKKTIAQRLG